MAKISDGEGNNETTNKVEIGTHNCTEKDFKKMNDPSRSSKNEIEKLRAEN